MDNERQIPTTVDPTSVTTQFVLREIASLKELVFSEINGIKDAAKLAHDDIVRVPTDVQKQVGALKDLVFAKFDGEHQLKEVKFEKVDQRFELIERQRLEQKEDTSENVEKALSAAKEVVKEQSVSSTLANNKTEAYFTKQIDSLNEKINDMKNSIIRIEAIALGSLNQKTETRSSSSYVWGIVAIIASIIFGLVGVYMGVMLQK